MNPIKASRLIEAVGPRVVSVSVYDVGRASLEFDPTATQAERDAANAVLAGFDWSDAADAAWKDAREPDLTAMRVQAQAALDANATFLAIASPSNAQISAQVRALTNQNQRLIRALARLIVRGS